MRVDPLPALPADRLDAPLGEQVGDVAVIRPGALSRPASASWIRQVAASCPSFLFVPITPLGPRRIQPVTYSPGQVMLPVDDAPGHVRDRPPALVERDFRNRRCPCSRSSAARGRNPSFRALRSAARRVSRPHGPRAGSARPRCARLAHRPAARPARSGSAARFASACPRARAQRTRARSARSRVRSCSRRLNRARPATPRVELHVRGIHDHVRLLELAELEQLRVGEGGLCRPATAEDHDFLDRRRRQAASIAWSAVSVLRSSSALNASMRAQSIATLPLPIDHHPLAAEVELTVGMVGVAVVPAHERRGRLGARAGPRPGSRVAGRWPRRSRR